MNDSPCVLLLNGYRPTRPKANGHYMKKRRYSTWEDNERLKSTGTRKLRLEDRNVLLSWLNDNLLYPYPDDDTKLELRQRTTLSRTQIDHWFINERRRHVPQMLAKVNISPQECESYRRRPAADVVEQVLAAAERIHTSTGYRQNLTWLVSSANHVNSSKCCAGNGSIRKRRRTKTTSTSSDDAIQRFDPPASNPLPISLLSSFPSPSPSPCSSTSSSSSSTSSDTGSDSSSSSSSPSSPPPMSWTRSPSPWSGFSVYDYVALSMANHATSRYDPYFALHILAFVASYALNKQPWRRRSTDSA